MIKGIDYISNDNGSATSLAGFQSYYSTKDDLKFSAFSAGEILMVAVTSGQYGVVTAYYSLSAVPDIKILIQKAKQKIEAIRK